MAEETTSKIYCMPSDSSSLNPMLSALLSKDNSAETAALLNNQNGWNNNPFVYLVWMMMMRYMGNGWNENGAENFNSRQIASLQDTVSNNHNNDLVMQAMNNNQSAIRELAQTFNSDITTMQMAIGNVKAAIESVGGQVGFSAERVINAINLGDQNITSKICECCCNTQKAILTQGYENQLANERQTGLLGSKIDSLQSSNQLGQFQMQSALGSQINDTKNTLINGFSQIGYAAQQNTNAIIQAGNANTQRILDQMCSNTTQELRDKLAEMSQTAQTASIVSQLKNSYSCGCNQ